MQFISLLQRPDVPDPPKSLPSKPLRKTLPHAELLPSRFTFLFVFINKPHKAVSSSTISRWITDVLKESGIDTEKFKAHSTIAAAKICGILLSDIMERAHWSRSSIYILEKFYHKQIVEEQNQIISFESQGSFFERYNVIYAALELKNLYTSIL